MKWISRSALFFVIWLTIAGSCKKPDNGTVTGGGKGGSGVITVSPEHHGLYVDSCTIFIKYGTNDAPANGVYDDSVVCVLNDTIPVAVFPGMKKGLYYLYGLGYHVGFVPPYVKGGVPCTLSSDNTKITVYLPTYSYQP